MIILETDSLDKSYGFVHAVNHLSIQVESGKVYGILGPNGSGKTTTLSMLMGIVRQPRGDSLQLFHDRILSHLPHPSLALAFRVTHDHRPARALCSTQYPATHLSKCCLLPSARYANKNKAPPVVTPGRRNLQPMSGLQIYSFLQEMKRHLNRAAQVSTSPYTLFSVSRSPEHSNCSTDWTLAVTHSGN